MGHLEEVRGAETGAVANLPDADDVVRAGGEDALAVGVDGERAHGADMAGHDELAATLAKVVPRADVPVATAGEQSGAVGTQRHAQHRAAMTAEASDRSVGLVLDVAVLGAKCRASRLQTAPPNLGPAVHGHFVPALALRIFLGPPCLLLLLFGCRHHRSLRLLLLRLERAKLL